MGENLSSCLCELSPVDAQTIQETYRTLQDLLHVLKNCLEQKQPLNLLVYARERNLDETVDNLAKRLRAIPIPERSEDEASQRLRKNLHDVRGGAFASLVVSIELILLLNTEISQSDALRTFYLVRDQLKILRNCFADLDQERSKMDRALNLHSSELIRQKWDGFQRMGKTVRCQSSVHASIACCCLEFSTVDRVIYNLMNNALTYGVGEAVDLWVQADQATHSPNLLITVENDISLETKEQLESRFKGHLEKIFLGGFSTSGGGDGLQICLDCVRNAYGYTSADESLEAGLLGARIYEAGDTYRMQSWFFWPLMADA